MPTTGKLQAEKSMMVRFSDYHGNLFWAVGLIASNYNQEIAPHIDVVRRRTPILFLTTVSRGALNQLELKPCVITYIFPTYSYGQVVYGFPHCISGSNHPNTFPELPLPSI